MNHNKPYDRIDRINNQILDILGGILNKYIDLNYLGFALRKLGKFEEAEKFYLQGLSIEPNHNGINEYLGELYIQTNRIDLAKERLEVLKGCNCEEFEELKELIEEN